MYYGFTLDPGETILRVIHRHPIDLLPSVASSVLLVIFAIGFAYLDARFPANIPFPSLIVLSIISIVIVLAVLIFVIGFYVFHRNVLIFTNVHLVEVEQFGLFGRTVSQVSFARVQDVTGTRSGILATILNYGDVEIQSAGEQEKFIYHTAPNPQKVADDALAWHEKCTRDHATQGPATPAD
jgi:membrane protein YdbS with pleckstrin-like domain